MVLKREPLRNIVHARIEPEESLQRSETLLNQSFIPTKAGGAEGKPRARWRLGFGSASMTKTGCPLAAACRANKLVKVVLPTPPLPLNAIFTMLV